jgi:hypothetical protein
MTPASSHRPRWMLVLLATLIAVIIVEAGSYLLITVAGRMYREPIRRRAAIYEEQARRIRVIADSTDGLLQLDSVLGWRFRAGFRGPRDRISLQGLRSEREYTAAPPDSVMRIAAFGDSFVYGSEVANDAAWTVRMEQLSARVELLNYGVGGYGDDQAYLRFLAEVGRLKPRVVIMGFVSDDLRRVTNVYRRFISTQEVPLFKPRFVLRDSSLTLLPNPAPTRDSYLRYAREPQAVRELKPLDQWYEAAVYDNPLYDHLATVRLVSFLWSRVHRRYLDPERIWHGESMNRQSEAFLLQTRIFERFVQAADSIGVQPLIVFLPDARSVERARAGQPTVYANLADEVASRRLPHMDAIEAFRAAEIIDHRVLFAPGGHYSAAGNDVLARWLLQRLAMQTGGSSDPPTAPVRP